jgi:hypothetical protein
MTELRVLNIDAGGTPPIVGTPELARTIGATPACPDCEGNHWMHEQPDVADYRLRCMDCGAQFKLVGTQAQ